MTRREAAAYVRLSVRTFSKEVDAGSMPAPLSLTSRRKLWSRAALDRAIDPQNAMPEVMEAIRAHYAKAS